MLEDKLNLQYIPEDFRNYEKLPEVLKMIDEATQHTDPSTI
jgi:hypothetical protein